MIDEAASHARKLESTLSIITFDPHPRKVLQPKAAPADDEDSESSSEDGSDLHNGPLVQGPCADGELWGLAAHPSDPNKCVTCGDDECDEAFCGAKVSQNPKKK